MVLSRSPVLEVVWQFLAERQHESYLRRADELPVHVVKSRLLKLGTSKFRAFLRRLLQKTVAQPKLLPFSGKLSVQMETLYKTTIQSAPNISRRVVNGYLRPL